MSKTSLNAFLYHHFINVATEMPICLQTYIDYIIVWPFYEL